MFKFGLWWLLHNSVNILKNTELLTLKWVIAWYMNFISTKFLQKKTKLKKKNTSLKCSLKVLQDFDFPTQ